jgi:hypothetical protein
MPPKVESGIKSSCLDGGDRQAKPSGSFRDRQPLKLAKQSNSTQIFSKPADGVGHDGAPFFFGEDLFRAWTLVGHIDRRGRFGVPFENRSGHAPPPQHHQRFIDGYTRHPGCECGVSAKSIETRKCALKRLLQGVLRILPVPEYSKGRTIDPGPMTQVQFSEGAGVSRFCLQNERLFVRQCTVSMASQRRFPCSFLSVHRRSLPLVLAILGTGTCFSSARQPQPKAQGVELPESLAITQHAIPPVPVSREIQNR